MTRTHRNAHRLIFLVLAVAIPSLLIAGIALRPTVPPVSSDETLFRDAGFAPADVGQEVEIGIDGLRFALAATAQGDAVSIRPIEIIAKPDLLVYWAEDRPRYEQEDLATRLRQAHLVGTLSGRSRRLLKLPEGADSGHLLIYSLGYGELLSDLPIAGLAAGLIELPAAPAPE
jgi:hypothetical protein